MADVNTWVPPANTYDWIVVRGTLHHTLLVRAALLKLREALRPDGTLWVSDPLDPSRVNGLIAGVLLMILPTTLSYGEKLGHLLRVRSGAIRRMQAAIETEGASPFEGIGRSEEPVTIVRDLFEIISYEEKAAFAGFLSAELQLPYRLGTEIMRLLWLLDRVSVRLGLLRGLNYTLYARRPAWTGEGN